jgi:Icc protein
VRRYIARSLLLGLLVVSWSLFGASHLVSASEGNAPLLRVAVMSDIHLQNLDLVARGKFVAALNDLAGLSPRPQVLVVNGDLGNGKASDYEALCNILQKKSHPAYTFFAIGNHEYYQAWYGKHGNFNPKGFPNEDTPSAAKERFLALTGERQVYYDRWVEGVHLIFLGSEGYDPTEPERMNDAELSKEQLAWLREKLREGARADRPIFVFLHQPLPGTVASSQPCCGGTFVKQHEELRRMLAQYPQVVLFSGHTHARLNTPGIFVRQGFTMVGSSSVYQPEREDGQPVGAEASEGLIADVYHDRVEIAGRDFAHGQWLPGVRFVVPLSRK